MFKLIRKIIIFSGVLFFALIIFIVSTFLVVKNLKIKDIVEKEIENALGIQVTIKELVFSPLLVHIGAVGVTVHNPDGFPEGELAYINSIHIFIDPVEVISRKKPSIYLFSLDLDRLNIIKNREGKVNLKEIATIKEDNAPRKDGTHFYFDVLILSIGEVKYIDFSSGTRKEHKYPIGLKAASFVGLKNEDEVVKMVIYKAISNTDIGKLINLTVMPVFSQLSDTLGSAWSTAKSGASGIWGVANMPFKLIFGKD